jgi:hypothetical protein
MFTGGGGKDDRCLRADKLITFICRNFEVWATYTPGYLEVCPDSALRFASLKYL